MPLVRVDPYGEEFVLAGAGGTALTCAAVDGPLPIGDAVGVCILVGAGIYYCCSGSEEESKPVTNEQCKPKKKKKDKYKCTTKARFWSVGTPCYEKIFTGYGKTKADAKAAAQGACQGAGCHKPGKGGDCGHTTCIKLP